MTSRHLGLFASVTLALATAGLAHAEDLPAPVGTPLLTLSGAVETTNVDAALVLDLAMLQDLASTEFETTTIWTEGTNTFRGVSLHTLMQRVGVTEGTILASAINDYTVEIPVEDAVDGGPIVAYLLNGAPMSIRDKGPLWVVYPYDSDAAYRTEVIYSRSIWQLDRMEVVR